MPGVTLLGIPHDDNSSHLRGAADAPPLIRGELYSDASNPWTETGIELGENNLHNAGDIDFGGSRDAWDVIEERVGEIVASGSPLLSLGGDHAITHPILRAFAAAHKGLTIVHVDAHPDLYDNFQDNPRSHASPFARIMEERLATRLIQVGVRTVSGHQRRQIERFGVEAIEARHWNGGRNLEIETPIYVSIDLDGLDPSCAPGVSHREPGGLTTRQVIDLIQSLNHPIVGADVVEYNPTCDISNMTATVAAKLVKELAGMMLAT